MLPYVCGILSLLMEIIFGNVAKSMWTSIQAICFCYSSTLLGSFPPEFVTQPQELAPIQLQEHFSQPAGEVESIIMRLQNMCRVDVGAAIAFR